MYLINAEAGNVQKFIAGSGGVTAGDLVVISSGKVVKAAAAVTAATIVGIAIDTAAENGYAKVQLLQSDSVISAPYAGSSKTSLADTDFGTVFDLTDSTKVNLDDTTGGCALCVGYDNTPGRIFFKIPKSFLYI